MSHDHGAATSSRTRLSIALAITSVILIAEVVGAVTTDSLALLVDAGHMLTDVAGLTAALVAAGLMSRPATSARTWGYRRAEVLAALGQAAVLLAVGIYALVEGVQRLLAPPEVPSSSLLIFGIIGLVGNVASLAVLSSSRGENLNLRAAFLEVLNDALGSVAVIAAAILISLTGWTRADVIAGMLIAVLIIPRTVGLLRETTGVLLESTPRGLDLEAVRTHMLELPHVRGVHDLHASQIATGLPILSAHVVVEQGCFEDGHAPRILDDLQSCVLEHFSVQIEHSTFQLEPVAHQAHEHVDHA
ncbi:cobalt-zinc-cadmium efflux system protein [Frondihabitans sp. PhB188]|uniref:cation diffusion facilitator family transporter n=1 Tax=Frondihabitans sp. PhB188 TaxID=2485200 RepID=UPI000F49C921|nr:cation diffusion facilitator family transporter [Frondihabitans sp. PhB188]ROQ39596.1 cobalt-zinc-cadmium efflux system protein [Frondihabitans sp. PhB188]